VALAAPFSSGAATAANIASLLSWLVAAPAAWRQRKLFFMYSCRQAARSIALQRRNGMASARKRRRRRSGGVKIIEGGVKPK